MNSKVEKWDELEVAWKGTRLAIKWGPVLCLSLHSK